MNKRLRLRLNLYNSLSVLIVLATLFFVWPVKVLLDWKVTVDEPTVKTGQTIILHSTYNKIYDAQAKSQRFLDCTLPNGSTIDIPIQTLYPSRAKGSHNAESQLTIPLLPETGTFDCRVLIHVNYLLFNIKPINQNNVSNNFMVVSKGQGV